MSTSMPTYRSVNQLQEAASSERVPTGVSLAELGGSIFVPAAIGVGALHNQTVSSTVQVGPLAETFRNELQPGTEGRGE